MITEGRIVVKILAASLPVRTRDIEANMRTMTDAMSAAAGKADVILFGESALQGFDCLCWDYETDKCTAVEVTNPTIKRLQSAAREHHIAVSFGLIECAEDALYSSQIFIGADGEIVDLFRRVSIGWKEFGKTVEHYREGAAFGRFSYGGVTFSVGLCGDLWTEGRPEEMNALNADLVLWPVWCDYRAENWNCAIKHEYAKQAAICGKTVLLVNPFCADPEAVDCAAGGAAVFQNGEIVAELPAGQAGCLMFEL